MENETCPVYVDVRVFEIVTRKELVLKSHHDLFTILTENFQDAKKRPFMKAFEIKLFKNFWTIYPATTLANTLVLGQSITHQSLNEIVDVPTLGFVLAKYLPKAKFREVILYGKDGPYRKRYMVRGHDFVCS